MATEKMNTREEISAAVHCALVEILSLQAEGLPFTTPINSTPTIGISDVGDIRFEQSEDGVYLPVFLVGSQSTKEIVQSLRVAKPSEKNTEIGQDESSRISDFEQSEDADHGVLVQQHEENQRDEETEITVSEEITPEESAQNTTGIENVTTSPIPPDQTWLEVSFARPDIKFAVSY